MGGHPGRDGGGGKRPGMGENRVNKIKLNQLTVRVLYLRPEVARIREFRAA